MANQQPTCLGCFVNNPNLWALPENPLKYWIENGSPVIANPIVSNPVGLTNQEKECLNHLAQAWNCFAALQEKHPQDNSEFCEAIHSAQKMIALRVARRVDKDVWSQWA